jgi:hypothetical protein
MSTGARNENGKHWKRDENKDSFPQIKKPSVKIDLQMVSLQKCGSDGVFIKTLIRYGQ